MKQLLIFATVTLISTTWSLSQNWPSFRGEMAAGTASGLALPDGWDVEGGLNLKWKVTLPGLAHSSPIIWEDRVFVTTAVSSRSDATFRHGLYGDGDASTDLSVQEWKLFCFDRDTGRVLWERTAHRGVPRSKRHIKATYANATPATDGRYVVALFGSEGLFAYTLDGEPVWRKDLGDLDLGAYNAPEYEWGPASSPIIFGDRVIVQCDSQGEDFVMAVDLRSGATLWRTAREELPTWGTPTVFPGPSGPEIITNGSHRIRAYDPEDGRQLWELGGSSKITAPTPVHSGNVIVVASGRRPEKPIFAIQGGARGNLSLEEGQTSSDSILWSHRGRGSYMPTPLILDGLVYVISNQGILDCYDLMTGREIYRQRLRHAGGGFSASPVAADGRIYLSSEDGDIFVVRSGPEFELIGVNTMPERLMATPALSDNLMLIRGERTLWAIGTVSDRRPARPAP